MLERIKELREYEDLSMNEIAQQIGVAKGTYSTWEYHRDIIPLKRLLQLCNIYNVDVNYIFGLSNDKLILLSEFFGINIDKLCGKI